MDQSMNPQGNWESELLFNLGHCQAFVALLSGRYVASKTCGMEWDAFSRRQVSRVGDASSVTGEAGQTAILPVIWAPPARGAHPTGHRPYSALPSR
jgi:hypothetical protein